jgi:hypothetical protein
MQIVYWSGSLGPEGYLLLRVQMGVKVSLPGGNLRVCSGGYSAFSATSSHLA